MRKFRETGLSEVKLFLFIVFSFLLLLVAKSSYAAQSNAAEFNAPSNSYISVPSSTELKTFSALTMEAWIKPVSGGGEWALVMGKQFNPSDSNPWYSYRFLAASANSGEKGFPRRISFNIAPEGLNEVGVASTTVVPVNIWTHVAGVYDGATMKIYINGELENTVSQTGNLRASDLPFYIGKAPWTNYNNYHGQMDELRIWNIPRTQEEIKNSMNCSLSGSENGLVAYWPFNDTAGSPTADDLSENNNIGTLYNGAAIVADSTAPICFPPPSNMLSWWKGEDNAVDSKGSNNGTMMNGATYDVGKVGQAFSFDGVDDYVNVPDSSSVSFSPSSPITVDLWAYRTGNGTTMHLVGKRLNCGSINYQMAFDATSGLHFLGDSGGVITNTDLPLNTWTHLAGTFDGVNTFKFYINGVLAGTGSGTLGPTNTFPLTIAKAGSCGYLFEGLIDEVEIFDRALTADEIEDIYRANSAGKCFQEYTLTITKTGTGSGTVTSDPEGIDCGNTEPQNVALNKPVTALTNSVTGSPGAANDGDAGNVWYSYQSCPTSYNSFIIDLESLKTIKEIHFFPAQLYTYTIWTSEDGESWTERHTDSGEPAFPADWITIAVDGAYSARYIKYEGVNNGCGYVGMMEFEVYENTGCSSNYISGKEVALTATPDAGSVFAGWSGDEDCSDGEVTMDTDKTCTAEFNIITEPLADLTGNFYESLTEKCKEKKEGLVCKVKGKLIITNIGEVDAHNVHLRIYLSDDDSYDEGDILLDENNKGDVIVGKSYRKSFNLTLPVGISLEGRYIIVHIDSDDTTTESNESNNFVVSGEDE